MHYLISLLVKGNGMGPDYGSSTSRDRETFAHWEHGSVRLSSASVSSCSAGGPLRGTALRWSCRPRDMPRIRDLRKAKASRDRWTVVRKSCRQVNWLL